MDSNPENRPLIEGVGDEVIQVLSTLICVLFSVSIFIYTWFKSRSQQNIHPESQTLINSTRERVDYETQRRSGGQRSSRIRNDSLQCPVCLAEAKFVVETNCSHKFCGQCIISYWHQGNWLGTIRCPICRQTVTLLLFNFTPDENRTTSEEKRAIVEEINTYNRRFSGEPISIMQYLQDLPTILRHCVMQFFSIGGLVWVFRLRLIFCFLACIIYFITPIDIIPESVFGILGFLDDIFILFLLAIYVSIIYRRYISSHGQA